MTRRFALVALWLGATVVAILMASFAVRLVGDTVVAQGPPTVSRGEVEADLSTVPPGSEPGTTAITEATAAPTAPPAGDDAPPAPTTATTAPPTAVAPLPTTTLAEPAPPPTTTEAVPTTVPLPAPTEQSFALVGGSVRVRCTGNAASLVSSSPNPGFAMEVHSTGPDRVEVRFSADRTTSELRASCRDGQVEAEPKESSSGGGSDR